MPIYEYLCPDCGHPFEELVSGTETPRCPACAGERVQKQFSTFGVGDGKPEPGPSGCEACPEAGGPGGCPARTGF